MDLFLDVFAFLQSPAGVALLLSLVTVSEALASIPAIKANSIFQLVAGVLGKLTKKQPAA